MALSYGILKVGHGIIFEPFNVDHGSKIVNYLYVITSVLGRTYRSIESSGQVRSLFSQGTKTEIL